MLIKGKLRRIAFLIIVFTVTFDHFNASLLHKSIYIKKQLVISGSSECHLTDKTSTNYLKTILYISKICAKNLLIPHHFSDEHYLVNILFKVNACVGGVVE